MKSGPNLAEGLCYRTSLNKMTACHFLLRWSNSALCFFAPLMPKVFLHTCTKQRLAGSDEMKGAASSLSSWWPYLTIHHQLGTGPLFPQIFKCNHTPEWRSPQLLYLEQTLILEHSYEVYLQASQHHSFHEVVVPPELVITTNMTNDDSYKSLLKHCC